MNWKAYIETNDAILVGKPIIKGTRLSVEHIISLLASGLTEQQILETDHRHSKERFQAVFAFIQDILKDGLYYHEPLKSA